MSHLTRRQLLVLGAAGASAVAVGGAGLLWTNRPPRFGNGDDELLQPQVLSSVGGLLAVDLEAAPARVQVGDRSAALQVFNGSLPGPTLRIRPGDVLRVRMRNSLPDPTNLHVHGLHVSPSGNGDNPFVSIASGASFDYEYRLPADHRPGTYWYHPHHHGHVADQLAAGLFGAIIVADADPPPVTRERVMIVSDLSLDSAGNLAEVSPMDRMVGREGDTLLVNGQLRPRLLAAPGQREHWRLINACPSRYLRLTLDGQTMRLLGRDVGRLPDALEVTHVDLLPGNRVDLLIEVGEGSATLVATPIERGGLGAMMGGQHRVTDPFDLATLEVAGTPDAPLSRIAPGPVVPDLRERPVARRRTVQFAMTGMMGGGGGVMSFTIDDREFDADRTDTTVAVGTVEEWTFVNTSPMDHPVHLHVWPMQLVRSPGLDLTEPTWLDMLNIPATSQVTVLVAFDDFGGRTVYHCHILDHEDLGMMAIIEAT